MEVPEELMLSVLQQSVGLEHETYMRILIQQKTSFEKIKEDLLTHESSYKNEENREVRYIPVNVFRSTGNDDEKKTALKTQRFQPKYKNTSSTSNRSSQYKSSRVDNRNSKGINLGVTCSKCRQAGHTKDECVNRIKCNYCGKSGHKWAECRSRIREKQTKVCDNRGNVEIQPESKRI